MVGFNFPIRRARGRAAARRSRDRVVDRGRSNIQADIIRIRRLCIGGLQRKMNRLPGVSFTYVAGRKSFTYVVWRKSLHNKYVNNA